MRVATVSRNARSCVTNTSAPCARCSSAPSTPWRRCPGDWWVRPAAARRAVADQGAGQRARRLPVRPRPPKRRRRRGRAATSTVSTRVWICPAVGCVERMLCSASSARMAASSAACPHAQAGLMVLRQQRAGRPDARATTSNTVPIAVDRGFLRRRTPCAVRRTTSPPSGSNVPSSSLSRCSCRCRCGRSARRAHARRWNSASCRAAAVAERQAGARKRYQRHRGPGIARAVGTRRGRLRSRRGRARAACARRASRGRS